MLNSGTAIAGVVVTTDNGDFLVGGVGGDDLTMAVGLIGLAGMAGNDTLRGSAGADFLIGDYFSPDLFSDTLPDLPRYDFTVIGNDKLYGGAGDDTLVGGPGIDTLVGGKGDDFFALLGVGQDMLVELFDGGIDTVATAASTYTLGRNFENLRFQNVYGDVQNAVHGIGNNLANDITGGLGADTIEGMGGNDSLSGGARGKDLLIGGAGRDSFEFGFGGNFGGGISQNAYADTVQDFTPGQDRFTLLPYQFGLGVMHPVADGPIKAAQFGLVGGVLTGKEAILYDQTAGDLLTRYGDVFAHVTPGMALNFHDFEWSTL